jgi:hypothetical protein
LQIGAFINPIPGHPLPAGKAAYPTPVTASQERAVAPIREASEVLEAEALLRHRQSSADWQQAFPDRRARRALQTYQALEQIQQRDYVSQVLGVDEYV